MEEESCRIPPFAGTRCPHQNRSCVKVFRRIIVEDDPSSSWNDVVDAPLRSRRRGADSKLAILEEEESFCGWQEDDDP